MKAFKLTQWGQPGEFVTVPKPALSFGDVLIRIKAAGLCRSDLDMMDSKPGSAPYANSIEPGYILGHENAGYVAELGAGVTDLKVGEAVVVHHMRHCGNCEYCTGGAEQHCEAYKRGAIAVTRGCGIDGGLAEYLVVPRGEVISVGDEDPIKYAPLTDAGVTAYHAVRIVVERLKPGTSAAVIGIGGLGSYAVQLLKLLTPARVFAIDVAEQPLKEALSLGADHAIKTPYDPNCPPGTVISNTTQRAGVDAILDFVGTDETLKLAAEISRPQGRIVLVGMEGGTLEVGWGLMATSCEFAISLGSTRQDLREVCALLKAGKLKVALQEFAFEQVQEAYDALREGRLSGRAVVVFP